MIYIIEDDDNIRELVNYTLRGSGFEAKGFSLPSLFFEELKEQLPELILLDIMLPETDGLSILRQLRARPDTAKIPVILVTAKDSEYDKVMGLDNGADDYISKPFGMMELIARIKALLRRSSAKADSDGVKEYTVGSLYFCPDKHIVRVGGNDISLTFKEFKILCMLFEHRSIVLTRDQLLNEIWGYSFDGESRTVDVHMRSLRSKLGSAGDLIETVRGIGYKIKES